MMDVLMIGILAISFGVICLFAHWCDLQIKVKKGNDRMGVL